MNEKIPGNTTGSKIVSNYYENWKAEFEIKPLSVSLSDLETMIREDSVGRNSKILRPAKCQ